jgi:hypothetical protein
MHKIHENLTEFPRISLSEERHLIARAQKGYRKETDEIILRHIGFIAFRISRKVWVWGLPLCLDRNQYFYGCKKLLEPPAIF